MKNKARKRIIEEERDSKQLKTVEQVIRIHNVLNFLSFKDMGIFRKIQHTIHINQGKHYYEKERGQDSR